MDQKEKELDMKPVDFIRATFDTQMATMATLQFQWEKIFKTTFEWNFKVQEDAREMLDEWLAIAKKSREDYQKLMDDSLRMLHQILKPADSSEDASERAGNR